MFKLFFLRLFICSLVFISFGHAQPILRAIEGAAAASKAARAAEAAEAASKATRAAEAAEAASKAARMAERTSSVLTTVEVANKFIWASQKFTRQISEMEVFCFMDKENITLFSNYIPPGFESTMYITTGDHGMLDGKELVRRLAYADEGRMANAKFEKVFKNDISIKIDPSVYQDASFRNMDWAGNQHLYVFNGDRSYNIVSFQNSEGKLEPLVEIEKHVYTKVIPEEFCRIAAYGNVVSNFLHFFENSKDVEVAPADIRTNINDGSVPKVTHNTTLNDFIQELGSSGLTLVNGTCMAEEKIEKFVFAVYKEPNDGDIFLSAADRLGEIELDLRSDKQTVKKGENGWGVGWYILIGVIVLGIIGSFVKDKSALM